MSRDIRIRTRLQIGAAFFLASCMAHALSLEDAERQMLERNHDIALARAAVNAAQAGTLMAAQRPNPALALGVTNIDPHRGTGSGPLKDKSVDSTIGLNYLVERGAKREQRMAIADAALSAARYDLPEARRQQRLALHAAYYDLKFMQERVRLLESSYALTRDSLAAAERRVKAGDLAPVDRARLEVEAVRSDNERRTSVADLATARSVLALLIGEDNAPSLSADDAWPEPTALPPFETARQTGRPDIQSARAREQAANAARALAQSSRTRDVTVGVQAEHYPPDDHGSFGASISIPLFWNYRYEGEIAKADADVEAARAAHEKVLAQARAEIAHAYEDLAAARDRLLRLSEVGLKAAEDAARGVEFAYARGAASLTDLLDARRQLRAVHIEFTQALAAHAKALAAWHAATDWEQIP